MELSGIEAAVLIIAAAFGVAVNTITGGGSLITLPALLAVGIPLKQSLAINMVALAIGGLGSVFGGLKSLRESPRSNLLLLLPTVLGSTLGALLLVQISLDALKVIIPILIFVSTISLFLPQSKRHFDNQILAYISVFIISIYGGFFGAGMGVMLVSILTIFNYGKIHAITALKNLQQVFINALSAVVLMSGGLVILQPTLMLILGGVIGGYTTGKYLEVISEKKLKFLMISIGLILSVVFAANILVA